MNQLSESSPEHIRSEEAAPQVSDSIPPPEQTGHRRFWQWMDKHHGLVIGSTIAIGVDTILAAGYTNSLGNISDHLHQIQNGDFSPIILYSVSTLLLVGMGAGMDQTMNNS